MSDLPLVSVLMAAYNSEKFIGIAIESVLNSTYKNFELIITDDNSTDNTLSIARSYENADIRVKVILNDKNYGDYPNRNQAASYAKGKYLKYVDHDDYIYPYGLEQLVYYMEQFPEAGYGLCSISQHKFKIFPFQLSPMEAYKMHYFDTEIFYRAPLSAIIKKEAFDAVGGFTGKPFLGDFELWHLLSQTYSVVLMPIGIVWYRVHEQQESNKMKADPSNHFQYLLLGETLINSPECPMDTESKKKVLNEYKIKQSKAILSAGKHHSIKKSKELLNVSGLNFSTVVRNYLK